jgi:molybdopterin synthase sulfur carrier subunit
MLRVKLPSVLASITNERNVELDIEECTVGELIEILTQRYGEKFRNVVLQGGKLNRFVNVFVNGKDIRQLDGLNTKIRGGEVTFIPAVAGG